MRALDVFLRSLASSKVLKLGEDSNCKCTPKDSCWPSSKEWSSLNSSLSGALIRGVPPAAVCYESHPAYNEGNCETVRSQWFNSTWHAQDPVSIDYPIWAENSCNPIYANGTSLTGDPDAGKKGCSIGRYSVYVVNARTPEHIGKAFKWAQKHNIRVVVKSTGHSYPGRSTGYGSLSIWTHNLRGIQYIPSFKPSKCPVKQPLKAMRVAAGHTGIEAQAEAAKHNVIVVTGANPDVGLIGWLTGGGHGTLSSSYGMGADNLLEATIVTPSGKTLVANPCQNSDLFFAIRGGGGGTYGVALEAVVQAFPTPKTTVFTFAFAFIVTSSPESHFWDMIGFVHSEMARLKKGGMQGYYVIVGPPVYPTLAFQGGFYLYDKLEGTVETLMAPILARLDELPDLFAYQSSIRQASTFFDSYGGVFANEQVATGGSAYGSRLLSPESLSDPNITAKAFAKIGPSLDSSDPNGLFINPVLIGHLIASPKEPTYYPSVISMNPAWRNTLVNFIVVEGWPDYVDRSLIDAVYQDITHNKTQVLRDLSPDTGAYFNEADSYEPDWQNSFFGKNYPKLKKIKEKYDPDDILWCRRCVGSEALVEQADGRLCKARYSSRTEDGGGGARYRTRTEDKIGDKKPSEALEPHDGKRTADQMPSFETRDIEEETDWHRRTSKPRVVRSDLGKRGHFSGETKESGWNHKTVGEAGAHHLHDKRKDDMNVWIPDREAQNGDSGGPWTKRSPPPSLNRDSNEPTDPQIDANLAPEGTPYKFLKREASGNRKRTPNQTPAFSTVSKNVDEHELNKRGSEDAGQGGYRSHNLGRGQSKRHPPGSTFKIYTLATKPDPDNDVVPSKRDGEEGSEWSKRGDVEAEFTGGDTQGASGMERANRRGG